MKLLFEQLREVDEVTVLELLELTTDDLIDAFADVITDKANKIQRYLDENE